MAKKTKQLAPVAQTQPVPEQDPQMEPQGDVRRRDIAEAAYHRAEARGFAPGGETEDWLAAERELDAAQSGPA